MADYEDTNISNLIINNISQEKFEELKTAGQLEATQVYLTPEQGGGAALLDQTDNAGKFLTTDGVTASWGNALVNVAKNNQSLVIDGTTVGPSVDSVVIGHGSVAGNNNTSGGEVVVGVGAKASTTSFSSHGVAVGNGATADSGIAIGWFSNSAADGIAIGRSCDAFARGVAIGNSCDGSDGTFSVSLGKTVNYNTIYYTYTVLDNDGNVPRERLKNLVEVLPAADNGYTTVKNFGNGYVEITGYASIGAVGAGTGSEVQIDLPAGYTMADANYWVNIAPTSETTMFDFKAEAKARSTTHFMVAYKNEDDATGLTAAGVYWEVRGMLATA